VAWVNGRRSESGRDGANRGVGCPFLGPWRCEPRLVGVGGKVLHYNTPVQDNRLHYSRALSARALDCQCLPLFSILLIRFSLSYYQF